MKQKVRFTGLLLAVGVAGGLAWILAATPKASAALHTLRPIVYPVVGRSSYVNDYYVPRPSGVHAATDIMADKGQLLVSTVTGTVTYVTYPQPSWGYAVFIEDAQGYEYRYLHINDDRRGTNDGLGGGMGAYAPDIREGNRVVAGQLIGWVGDSGNSNGVPHLHFEMAMPDESPINPYYSLQRARRVNAPVPYGALRNEILPNGTGGRTPASVAMGNFDNDSQSEMVVGATDAQGRALVKVYDHNNSLLRQFLPLGPYKGTVDVAMGNVQGDARAEIIIAAGPGSRPRVRFFTQTGGGSAEFMGMPATFTGGITVSAGDIDGDNLDEIVIGAGRGAHPFVYTYEANGTPIDNFLAFASNLRMGVDVGVGDVTGTNTPEIVTGPGRGGDGLVKIHTPDGTHLRTFNSTVRGTKPGVRVSVGNVDTDTAKSEIMTVSHVNGFPTARVHVFSGSVIDGNEFVEEWWQGIYDVAAGTGTSRGMAGGNRRTTVRNALQY